MTCVNYGTAGRIDRIRMDLIELAKRGVIPSGWWENAPGYRGRRWHIGDRTYSTREVEAFIHGTERAKFGD